jgi:hypothetical protein
VREITGVLIQILTPLLEEGHPNKIDLQNLRNEKRFNEN